MPSSIVLLKSTVITSATNVVDFTNIQQTCNDLWVKMCARTTVASNNEYFNLRMNNDGGSVYYKFTQYSNGTNDYGTQTWQNQTDMYVYQVVGDTATSNTFSSHELYIPNYNLATNKPVLEDSCSLTNSTTSNSLRMVTSSSMLWRPTTPAAINRLTFTTASGNFKVGSSFYLYGIKK